MGKNNSRTLADVYHVNEVTEGTNKYSKDLKICWKIGEEIKSRGERERDRPAKDVLAIEFIECTIRDCQVLITNITII